MSLVRKARISTALLLRCLLLRRRRTRKYLHLGKAILGGDNDAWGRQIPVELSAVDMLRFVSSDGRASFTATFDAASPWK